MKNLLVSALMLAAGIAAEIEKATGEKILDQLDLQFDDKLPTAVPDFDASDAVFTFNDAGFSTHTDAYGRVRFEVVDAFIAECKLVDPVRASRVPGWFYWPPSYIGPNASVFPSDESREFAWMNFFDRWWIHPYLHVQTQFARRYEREAADPKLPKPASLLGWKRASLMTDTKAYEWGFSDASKPLADAKDHWENFSREEISANSVL